MSRGVQDLIGGAADLVEDDLTDKKFQLEDQKRKLAQQMFELTSGKRLKQVRAAYNDKRSEVPKLVSESGNDRERHAISEIIGREQTFVNTTSPERIQQVIDELARLEWANSHAYSGFSQFHVRPPGGVSRLKE